jgi:hypothetical protein
VNVDCNEHAERITREMHRSNSEQALQAIIELLLTDHTTAEVVAWLRTWAAYLQERT